MGFELLNGFAVHWQEVPVPAPLFGEQRVTYNAMRDFHCKKSCAPLADE